MKHRISGRFFIIIVEFIRKCLIYPIKYQSRKH